MFKAILLVALLLFLLGCSALPGANPTPVIVVVTATPAGTRAPVVTFFTPTPPASQSSRTPGAAGTVNPNATPDGAETATLNLKATDVKYVRAKQDINIRSGPGTNFDIVGGVFAGNTAEVTGYKSADDLWWRVVCPVEDVTDCWVSADLALTEPTTDPSAEPSPSPSATSTASVSATATGTTTLNLETFTQQLAAALVTKNYDALSGMMGDPFTIGYWRSEGTTPSRAQAVTQLKGWIDPANEIVVDLADKTDQGKLLEGTPPLQMWDPKVKVVKTIFVEGLGADQKGQGILVIAQRDDASLYWYALLYAAGGFDTLN